MALLRELMDTLEKTNPRDTHNIAGYIESNTFHYHVSTNKNLPAALSLLDTFSKKKGMIFTNLNTAHWLYTYTGTAGADSEQALTYVGHGCDAGASKSQPIERQLNCWVVAGGSTDPGPVKGGGLFQAAKDLTDKSAVYKKEGAEKVSTTEKGLHRAVRYYMLAAYSLLGKCATQSYTGGNYIAALMVDDTGKILSYGINSGWFHHGEVNMLLNYFKANPTATKIPSKTIIFSTLTPCKQCSKYLEDARPADSIIFMGQNDPGTLGRVGEKHAVYLSSVTDPILNRVAKPIMKSKVVSTRVVKSWGKETTVPVMEEYQDGEKVERYALDAALSDKMGLGASVAEQIGTKCNLILNQSMVTLTHKFDKVRANNQEGSDQAVKIPVLSYLRGWIAGVKTTSKQI